MDKQHLLKNTPQYAKLLLAFFLAVFSFHTLYAYDLEVDGIYYNINDDGTSVTVTSGDTEYSGDVVIPATIKDGDTKTLDVTAIGDEAFMNCSSLTSIDLPESIRSIGEWAFTYSSLSSLTISKNVTSIGEAAFSGCPITSIMVALLNPVYDSREGCNAIIEKSSNTLIVGCENTVIPNSVKAIGNRAFMRSTITSIEIPNSVTSIKFGAFAGTSLVNVKIPESVTNIGEGAFEMCTSLVSIEIPNGVTNIGKSAFCVWRKQRYGERRQRMSRVYP